MNFETMKYRENEVEDFGKRCLSWNGALVFYYVQVYVDTDVYEIRQETIYIYHINMFNNKQDDTCVVFSMELILNCIKKIFPRITSVILQSDNVRFYQNSIMTFFIHVRIISTGLFVSHYIHTYTGYSKGMIGGISRQ